MRAGPVKDLDRTRCLAFQSMLRERVLEGACTLVVCDLDFCGSDKNLCENGAVHAM